MTIKKLFGNKGAEKAEGFVVVIDIVRAATLEAVTLARGAKYIIPVASKEEAFLLKEKNPEYLIMGEEEGLKVKGFDFGNSPTELLKADVLDKVIVHRSSAGTQGLVRAKNAKHLVFGSFLTARAILKKIEETKPETICFVVTAGEDGIFADYMTEILYGENPSREAVAKNLYSHPGVEWFLDMSKEEFPIEDIKVALEIDKYDFYCDVKFENGLLKTQKAK
ncbi:MAG TPA: 2-phosphosulfolactate phosphatase [Patescibacteria group bacterium]